MKVFSRIPFTEIDSIPGLIKDFLEDGIEGFQENRFTMENAEKAIAEKEKNFPAENRKVFSEVLNAQMAKSKLSEKQKFHLSSLENSNTLTVCTGHQLNLFTGPVFFIYKILQTIKTVDFLKSNFPEKHFVPVFWMATEDHDFEEINHFKTKDQLFEISAKSGGAVGRIIVDDLDFIEKFEQEFSGFPYGQELVDLMKNAYEKGKTLAAATRFLVNSIFSDYGLLILDGDDARLKRLMIPTFEQEFFENQLELTTAENVNFLKSKYGKVQVNPREINLFHLSKTRSRIDSGGGNFVLSDSNEIIQANEIRKALHRNPENFSPNALMRPVFQETVLPNIAYIGGNAEIMYWLELKPYFEHLKLSFPLLIPRNSLLFISDKTVSKMELLELQLSDFFKNFDQIINAKLLQDHEITNELAKNQDFLKQNFERLRILAKNTDPSFENMVNAEEKRQMKSFDRFQKRLLRAQRIKEAELVFRMKSLFAQVNPNGNWQERVWNFSVFYSLYGSKWLETCLQQMDITQSELLAFAD